jgi:hypothetical protein
MQLRLAARHSLGLGIVALLALCACSESSDPADPGGAGGSGAAAGAGGNAGSQNPGSGGDAGTPSSGGSDASGGSGGAVDTAELVLPIERDGKHALEFEGLLFEVDSQLGARVVTYGLNGVNLMGGTGINTGSTFWTSPQANWNWPPPAEIDNKPYAATVSGNTITMTGTTNAKLGVSVIKEFSPDLVRRAITIKYSIQNDSDAEKTYAPWEITRVPGTGFSFFPTGSAGVIAEKTTINAQAVSESSGVTWVDYPNGGITSGQKLFADGAEGWLAHVEGDLLVVKVFPDVLREQQAPGEAEVELFAAGTASGVTYVELEPQGAYLPIAPGAKLDWTVTWYLREIPSGTNKAVGSAELVALARGLAQ